MKLPPWLPKLTAHAEKLRAAHGLTAKKDGWYKSVDGRTRYVCKPCKVSEAVEITPGRIKAIRAKAQGIRVPVERITPGLLTLEGLIELYLAWLTQRLETGYPKKLTRRTYDDITETLSDFSECIGPQKAADAVGAADFTLYAREYLAGKASSTIRRRIIYIEAFANWAAPGSRKAGHLQRPWQYGTDFRKPSDDEVSTSAADSDKAYTPAQLRQAFLRVKKSPILRAAGWLGLCAAFLPKDVGTLPEAIVDLKSGLIRFPRGKTGVGRMCWLPPHAVLAISRYLEVRPDACQPEAKGLLFRSSNGLPHYRDAEGEDWGQRFDGIGNRWSKMTGLPFSGLRSTFATIADDFLDQRSVDTVMGHKVGHVGRRVRSRHYAKRIKPERIQKLVAYVLPLAFGRVPRAAAAPNEPAPKS